MASEVSELSSIKDEDLLRRMWQQTEDFCRKKEIRAHMYKLREERLRNFYTGDMDAGIGMSKSPMIPSHGDSLADQSFQSLKAKEIRDCASPTRHVQYDMVAPDTSGWNVISTSQISSDGREQRSTTLATTDAVQDIQGGKAKFSGKNEVIESHRHDGDDKNYTTTSGHASNTILKEHVVTGDARNGRTESTSNTTSSSSKTVTSSKYQADNSNNDDFVQEFEGVLNSARRTVRENTNQSNSNNDQFERIPCNDFEKEYFNSKTTNKSSSTTSNQQSTYDRRNSASSTTSSVDARKIQRETEHFANAPGQLISRSVEYPDAHTKVITETKTLPDGSTVTTTKYETRAASSTSTSKSSKQEKSSTSRVVTEDRAERNRIEIIAGDNKNVIDEVVKSKRIVDADDKTGFKPDSEESFKERSVKREFYRNENARQDNTQKRTSNQEFIHKDNIDEQQRNVRHEEIRMQKEPVQSEFYRNENARQDNTQKRTSNQEFVHKDNIDEQQRDVRHEEIRKQKQPVQSEKIYKENVELNESSHDRRFQKQNKNNENVTSHLEITIEADQQKNNVSKQNAPMRNINTDDLYDKQSTETNRTVKKDLSHDYERYTKERPIERDLPEEHYNRQPVEEEIIVPKKEAYHICSSSHNHSSKPATKTTSKPDYTSKRISVDHNPTHEAFARSLRCVTPEIDKRSSTNSVKTNYTYTDRNHRSPSRDTNVSDISKISSTTVTKSQSPNRKLSPEKRKTTISSETIDITSSEQYKNDKKKKTTDSTVRKGSQTFTSSKNIPKSEDYYDHPRNNQPVYDVPTNNAPVRKNSSDQPSYSRPTASSTRHNAKPDEVLQKPNKKDNDEPIYETINDRPSNDRRHSSKIDSKTTVTTSVTRETKDYRNIDRPFTKQSTTHHQPEYESNFDSGRSNSPTSSVSDIEYVNFQNTNRTVTDLDEIEIIINTKGRSTNNRDTQDGLFLSTHKKKSSSPSLESDTDTIVEQEKDLGKEPFYLIEGQRDVTETRRQKPPLTRSETYEERCRTMLGMKMESEERETVKNSKLASTDLITSERKVENGSPSRSPTKSPDRKTSTNVVNVNVERSPSRSPERKPTSTKSTIEEDGRFDTFTRSKNNKSSSPKRTTLERPDPEEDTSTFDRKPSKVANDYTSKPLRSNNSSPDRKGTSEATKQFMTEEIRSSSIRTKDTHNVTGKTWEKSPKREPQTDSVRTTSPKRSPGTEKKVPADNSTFDRNPSNVTNDYTSKPVRSNNSSPDRKGTSEATKQFMTEEIRSSSIRTKDTQNVTGKTWEDSPKREPQTDSVRTTSPKRSPATEKKVPADSSTFDRNPSNVTNDYTSKPVRSNNSSPDRKGTSEATKQFVTEETRSSSIRTKDTQNVTGSTWEKSPKREPQTDSVRTTSPKRSPATEKEVPAGSSTFDRNPSKVTNDYTRTPVRSNSSSPDRKGTSETSKQFITEEIRSNSFTTKFSKIKDTQNTTTTSRERSPEREPQSDSVRTSTSPKRSQNRSPNTSPSRNKARENVVETTRKLLNSESDVRKSSKSLVTRSEERNTQIKQNNNKVNKETRPTRLDRTSPTRMKTDETITETTETFFSETKADTIKRRPSSENRNSVGKPIATSPDRKSTTKEVNRKSVFDDNKTTAQKKSTYITISNDSQDASRATTNTFTRKKTSESIETTLPSSTKPKAKPVDTSLRSNSPAKTTSAQSKTKARPVKIDIKSKVKPKQANNYSTDENSDEETTSKKSPKKIPITDRKDSAPVYRTTKVDKDVKMARSTSEHFSATPRKGSKPDIETPKTPQKIEKRPTKCMTTKTINLSTANTINSEDMENVIIDIQLAKSSREPTPNRIIPTPVSPEEDTGKPRYPDTVHEPDDERPQRRPNIKNIPIFEENTKEYVSCHITEVNEDYGASDSDECMLSVSDKVTKFSTQVTSPTNDKFKRNNVETVDEFSEDVDDESRLSVQGKVSKFTAIAEEVSTTKTSTNTTNKECNITAKVNEKVAQFTEQEVRNSKSFKQEPVRNTERVKTRRDFEDIDETLKSDECLLSVSDKVNKFVATAETLTASVAVPRMNDVKSPELVAKVHRQVSLRDTANKKDNEPRKPLDQHDSVIEKSNPKGKITDRYVPNKSKPTSTASVPISLSSIDVVKKAKSIFERDESPKAPKQRDILTRPSIWEQRRAEAEAAKADVKLTDIGVFKTVEDSTLEIDSRPSSRSPEPKQLSYSPEPRISSRSPEQRRPSYTYERSLSPVNTRRPHIEDCEQKKQPQKIQAAKKSLKTNDEQAPKKPVTVDAPDAATDKRSYMSHTIASLEHIRRDSIELNKSNIRKSVPDDEVDQVEINPKSSVKFGVELKRTNSQQSAGRRKSSSSEIPHVEEIFELELLERMLDTVVGYEQRRRIRAQIRLVRKQIQDEEKSKSVKRTTTNTNRSDITTESWRRKQEPSPARSPLRKKNEDVSEYTSKYSKTSKVERTTSPVRKSSPQRRHNENVEFISSERTATEEDVSVRRSSPNRKSSIDGNSNAYRNEQVNSYIHISRSPSPKPNRISSNLRNTEVKQVNVSKSNDDDKPIWARKNILTKASDATRTFTSSAKKTTVTKVQKQKTVEQNEDCVTSSYGIGPTDQDGKPLFGIRALKKKSPAVQTSSKVSGTIIQETLFSDNGAPPTGNRTTTMYSSDPQDVRHFVESNGTASDIRNRLIERENHRRGITSVTTSQTITSIDTPEDISESDSKQPRIVRRGSVKELSEKFQKESTKSSEKTTSSYPKAGLILRTQTSRESTPGGNSSLRSGSADFDDCDIEVRCSSSSRLQSDDEMEFKTTTTSRQHQTSSFLNTNRKVTDVHDVLNRMRNADNVTEDGDTEEDKEARALLNKFLGASVLMSGMESMVPREITTIVGAPSSQKQITTTHVLKTVKSTSSPSTTRELKTRDIDSIWDEELLKQLLDQSSSYEERRKIRARLRQVMAEKEVCADIVASVTAELKQQKLENETSKKMEVKQPAKKEESEEEEDDDDEYEYEEVEVEVTDDGEEESEHEAKVEVTKSNDSKKTASTTTITTTTTTAAAAAAEVKAATVTKSTVKVEEKKESSQESKTQVQSDEASKIVTTTSITNARTVSTAKTVPAKPISPFAKFRQLDKQVSTQSSPNSPNSPSTPKSPGGAPLFKFTDPVLSARAATVKDILLQWCQSKTKEYENVQITNFSTAWSDGLAFCALCHHFLPDSFDYSVLTPKQRRHNFTLAFRIMDEKAGIAPLLDVEDMVVMRKPDWKCVFTYVQSIHRRFRNVE